MEYLAMNYEASLENGKVFLRMNLELISQRNNNDVVEVIKEGVHILTYGNNKKRTDNETLFA